MLVEDSANSVISSLGGMTASNVTPNDYTKYNDFSSEISVVNHLGEQNLPCSLIAGPAVNTDYITIDVLKELHIHG